MENRLQQKETIIYGGAFNPPTLAHQAILQACVNHAETIDADVWLLPSGNRSDKTIEVPVERRLDMLRALSRDVVRRSVQIDILTTELERQIPTETIDTVQELNATYPGTRFSWVFGSDSVETMPSWRGGQWMMDNLPMLIVERPGSPVRTLGHPPTILPIPASTANSSEVRKRMAHNLSIDELVPPHVLACLQS